MSKSRSNFFIGVLSLTFLLGVFWYFSKSKEQRTMDQSSLAPEKRGTSGSVLPQPARAPKSTEVHPDGVPTKLAASSQEKGERAKTLEQYLKSLDSNAEWRINKTDQGRVIAISGALIKDRGSPAQLLELAQNIAELTGIPKQQIQKSSSILEDTPETRAHQFDQEVGDYKVFGGYMKIFTRKSDGAVYYIVNETRDVGDVDFRIKISALEGSKIAERAHFDANRTVTVETVSKNPVIYPSSSAKSGELAWEITLKIDGSPFDRRHLLISAISGEILLDVSLLRN